MGVASLPRCPSRQCWCFGLLVLIALLPIGWAKAATGAHVIRGLKVVSGPRSTVIELHLEGRFRYVSHSPRRLSSTLQVQLRAEDPRERASELAERQVIVWHARDLLALIDISVTLDSRGDPVIFLNFERPLIFGIRQGSDLERIRIAVVEPAEPRIATPRRLSLAAKEDEGTRTNRAERIMAEGRKAMTAGDFQRAAMLFTKVLGQPDATRAPEAKELLGLAYQRAGKRAHARAEYEEYLAAYPDHEGAERVRQRLQALRSARGPGQRRAKKSEPGRSRLEHSLSGSVSQFYRLDTVDTEVRGTETVNSSLDSSLFLSSRHTKGPFSARTNFSGSYRYDFLDKLDSEDAMRFTSAFVDLSSRGSNYSARLGRQSASGGGVLGRFDGIQVWRQMSETWRLGLVSGFPVDFTDSNRINSQRLFSGLSIDVGPFLERWDGQLFAIRQQLHGVEDRSAVGGQIRYSAGQSFALGLVDYDVSYSALNTLMFISNWHLTDDTSVSATVDIRKSPVLTTFNALQGQLVNDFDDLEFLFDEDEIRDLAEDRTAESRTVTLGASHRLSEAWQLYGDVTLSKLSGTDASGGVPATPGTGDEYFVSLRASVADLFLDRSFTTFGIRFADTDTSNRYSLTIAGRYSVLGRLRLGPRLLVEYRSNEASSNRWKYRPSLRLDVRWRRVHLELEGGLDLEKGTVNDSDADETEYFVTVGGRYDF